MPSNPCLPEGFIKKRQLVISLEKIDIVSKVPSNAPPTSSEEQEKQRNKPKSVPEPTPSSSTSKRNSRKNASAEEQDDANYWIDKVNTLNHCSMCLKTFQTSPFLKERQEIASMEPIWAYLNKENLFNEYVFIVEKEESTVPPLCGSCLNVVKDLSSLIDVLNKISKTIERRVQEIGDKIAKGDFQKQSTKLEQEMKSADLPFRCMCNTIQFLNLLHKRNPKRSATDLSKPSVPFDDNKRRRVARRNCGSETEPEEDPIVSLDSRQSSAKQSRATTRSLQNNAPTKVETSGNDLDLNSDEFSGFDMEPMTNTSDLDNSSATISQEIWHLSQKVEAGTGNELDQNSDSEDEGHTAVELDADDEDYVPDEDLMRMKETQGIRQSRRKSGLSPLANDSVSTGSKKDTSSGIFFKCPLCESKYSRKDRMILHWWEKHLEPDGVDLDSKLRGDDGPTNSENDDANSNSEDVRESYSKIQCEICKQAFGRKISLLYHREYEQDICKPIQDNPTCSICGRIMFSKKTLAIHMKVTHGNKDFSCQICHRYFRNEVQLKRHMRSRSHEERQNAKKPMCDVCGMEFKTERNLEAHRSIHSGGEKPFLCATCGAGFRIKHFLNAHIRNSHRDVLGLPRLECSFCGKSYKNNDSLKEHVNTFHRKDVPTFICDLCGQVFRRRRGLVSHKRTVHLKRVSKVGVECEHCNKILKNEKALRIHIRDSHLNPKPDKYSCVEPTCSEKFKSKYDLRYHVALYHPTQLEAFKCFNDSNNIEYECSSKSNEEAVHHPENAENVETE